MTRNLKTAHISTGGALIPLQATCTTAMRSTSCLWTTLGRCTPKKLVRKSCMVQYPSRLMQIFSLKLAQIPIDDNSLELYGYMAVREYRDSLLIILSIAAGRIPSSCNRYLPLDATTIRTLFSFFAIFAQTFKFVICKSKIEIEISPMIFKS
jgi:hypothetical protein